MKIGVFDSGLGGLVITKALIEALPQYDYLYYGDSAHLPYGDKTSGTILNYTLQAMKYLIKNDCKLIIIACNTATAITLRYIQQRFIPAYAPDIKVLGVVIPTVEAAIEQDKTHIGVLATNATVRSQIYTTELLKLNPNCQVLEIAAPELVPAIEANDFEAVENIAREYAVRFRKCQSLILGCTHYPLAKEYFRHALPDVSIISQDELMGDKLKDYLHRHPEIETALTKSGKREFLVSRADIKAQQVTKILFDDIKVSQAA